MGQTVQPQVILLQILPNPIDPEAKPELELVASFARDADAVEAAGYHRFAGVLRDLADTYQREADRILNDPEMQEHRDSSSQNN